MTDHQPMASELQKLDPRLLDYWREWQGKQEKAYRGAVHAMNLCAAEVVELKATILALVKRMEVLEQRLDKAGSVVGEIMANCKTCHERSEA